MVLADRLVLGAPGIYVRPDERIRELTGVPMDVAAFAGVAPRGPCRVPLQDRKRPDAPWAFGPAGPARTVATPVESWDAYRRLFGSFEGAGLLPYAVASFFDQGGRRAYILRIVHDYGDDALDGGGVASAVMPGITRPGGGAVGLRARDEGPWGNSLRATLTYRMRPLPFSRATTSELIVDASSPLSAGTLLRLTLPGGVASLALIGAIRLVELRDGNVEWHAHLDVPAALAPLTAEIVEGVLDVEDMEPSVRRTERHERLGFSSLHPRWLAGVLATDSALLRADTTWADSELRPDKRLTPATTMPFEGGEDRSAAIVPDDFFDRRWVPGDDERPGGGIQAIVEVADVSLLVTPDLYAPPTISPMEWIPDPRTLAGPDFAVCVDIEPTEEPKPRSEELPGLLLDPKIPSDLRRIIELQQALVAFVERLKGPVVLLDVPIGLSKQRMRAWRERFDSSFAAAYHPWLFVAHLEDNRDRRRPIPPSTVAAGIVARRERMFGVPYGPANELGVEVVDVVERVSPADHDELHPEGINVYLRERDGIRLTSGRTLSRDRYYRQLSVRRLMTMLRRVLEQQLQWMVFEPNDESLRASVRHMLRGYLGQLHQAGSFAGATEDESFFVRCDDVLNPARVVDMGQLIVEIGVAPAEPLEFLVLRFTRDGDGTLRVEGPRG